MKLLISESEIKKRVKVLANKINEDYKGKNPICLLYTSDAADE